MITFFTVESKGQTLTCLVDEADWELVSQYTWSIKRSYSNGRYARNHINQYLITWMVEDGVKRMVYLHRFLLGLKKGDKLVGDHINRDTLDNRRCNLRAVSVKENNFNTVRTKNAFTPQEQIAC